MYPCLRIASHLAAAALITLVGSAALAQPTAAPAPAPAPARLEVLHWWTSEGEAGALQAVKAALQDKGYAWEDSSVAGGDDRKRLVATARAGAGQLPDALQLHGFSLRSQARGLRPLDRLAQQERWDEVVLPAVRRAARVNGHWLAAPVDLHRTNWVWANKRVFDRLGLQVPRSFADFLAVADQLRAAGVLPLAHGREPWQDALLFDNAVLSAGGARLYRRALLEADPAALGGREMVAAFRQLGRLRALIDPDAANRPWNFASEMVASGKAGMQVMGDWAKGEFLKEGRQPGSDFVCFPYPGTEGSFVFVADMFAMPAAAQAQPAAQEALASVLLDPAVQARFNRDKGSLPVRADVPLDGFDACAQQAAADLAHASRRGTLVPRFASELPERVRDAITAVVSDHLSGHESAEQGARRLREAVARAAAAGKVAR
jgi:glucose/mannose transport system substrate-binding protein